MTAAKSRALSACCYGSLLLGVGSYATSLALSFTAMDIQEVYYKNCPSDSLISTQFGEFSCGTLASLVEKFKYGVPILSAVTPPLAYMFGVFCVAKVMYDHRSHYYKKITPQRELDVE